MPLNTGMIFDIRWATEVWFNSKMMTDRNDVETKKTQLYKSCRVHGLLSGIKAGTGSIAAPSVD